VLLRRLELADVRSYARAQLEFDAGVTLLLGPNAQGKTNLLEAVVRAATGGSHRVATDAPLVRAGTDAAVIRCVVETDAGRRRTVELQLGAGRTRTRVDGQDVRRAADGVGVLRVVLFAPEDLTIVRGDPTERRRFLDDLLAQRRPAYAVARSEYDRVLRQRNQLLKRARGLSGEARTAATSTLQAWSEQLVVTGSALVAARIAAVRTLASPVDRFYRDLADRPEHIALNYRSTVGDLADVADDERTVPETAPIQAAFRDRLAEVAAEERDRGVTLVGPHRDDLELRIGSLPAKGYASHGEAWSLALSLKLATFEVLVEVGDRPVVLLDDVFAELDEVRRAHLAAACSRFDQVLVTAAVEADVPLDGARWDVTLVDGVTTVANRSEVA
jgi:DNA replication and repair protein RecF